MKIYIIIILITFTSQTFADAQLDFNLNETATKKKQIYLSAPYFRINMENDKRYMIYDI